MRIDIITIFPKIFDSYFNESIIKRAKQKGLIQINIINLRDFTNDLHKTVDDKPFGDSTGMVMKIEPIYKALIKLKTKDSTVIVTTAKGEIYKQSKAKKFAKLKHLIIICGRYEGIDQRVLDYLADENISIGQYILTGGEIPAMIIVDSITRLLPGAIGNKNSLITNSFYKNDKIIQYPIYTRPRVFSVNNKNFEVPDILVSGDHAKIKKWQKDHTKIIE